MDGNHPMLQKRITAKQIAELAGVSRGTVDRVLHHRGGVKLEVQEKIESIIASNGYQPNRAGKALVMRRPFRIAVMFNSVGNPFYDEVRRGVLEARAAYSDFTVELEWREARGYDLQEQCRQLDEVMESGVDGLLITPINHPEVVKRLQAFRTRNIPVVAVNTNVEGGSRFSYVGCHYESSGRVAAQMLGLLSRGQGNVLVAVGSKSVLGHNQRVTGFQERLAEAFPDMRVVDIVETNDDDVTAAINVREAIRKNPDIIGLYVAAAGAVGCVTTAREEMKDKELYVVTCDLTEDIRNFLDNGAVQATIGQKPYRQGYESTKALIETFLFGEELPQQIYMENEIHIAYT